MGARKQGPVAIIGSATVDTIVQGGEYHRRLGGVVTYAGLTFRRHGIETYIVTNIAPEDSAILEPLRREGLRVLSGSSRGTTRFVNHLDGAIRWQEMPMSADPITAEHVKRLEGRVGHIHIGALHPGDVSREALMVLKDADVITSVDIQGFVRLSDGGRIVPRVSEALPLVLESAEFVKAGHGELETVEGTYCMTVRELMEEFSIDEFVVTRGSRGGVVLSATGEEYHYRAKPVEGRRGTVGAGDVFFAEYLIHRLYDGKTIDVSCERASKLVARHMEGRYIRGDVLSLESIHHIS